jgi:hypothetical protein
MALPTYEELMLPLLRHIADGRQYSYAELVPLLQRDFRLWKAHLPIANEGADTVLSHRPERATERWLNAGPLLKIRRSAMAQTAPRGQERPS